MSWVPVAEDSHFSIHNIPFGIFSPKADPEKKRGATIIGQTVVDLSAVYEAGLLNDVGLSSNVFAHAELNAFMEHTRPVWRATRQRLISLLSADSSDDRLRSNSALQATAFFPVSEVLLHLPARVTEYTDFYSSREHATNVGIMFRGVDNALQPNWLHLPVGYHGRASSIVVSGTDVRRPCGQLQKDPAEPKNGSVFNACRLLDFELEVGAFLGGPTNPLGTPVTIDQAEDRIFGLVLLNDWSARDIQAWEYVPLGPFTAKNFCTSISPWIVTLDALEPFRCNSSAGPVQNNPEPLEYLRDPNYATGTYDVNLSVNLRPEGDENASTISESNFKYLYWNIKQQLVHHSVTGASMRAGDLLGSGTISGPTPSSYGSLLELSWRGSKPVELKNTTQEKKTRNFLQDGDTLTLSGFAQCSSHRVGFGEVSGKILPASSPYLK